MVPTTAWGQMWVCQTLETLFEQALMRVEMLSGSGHGDDCFRHKYISDKRSGT